VSNKQKKPHTTRTSNSLFRQYHCQTAGLTIYVVATIQKHAALIHYPIFTMPADGRSVGQKGKKKKGRAPAHQNQFAYRHNPKSKKTEKILELPNKGVCRRCRDKIEWRKQYRKYKPRTQPGSCNICQQRRVVAAYHTICEKCSLGSKAKTTVQNHLHAETSKKNANASTESEITAPLEIDLKDMIIQEDFTAAAAAAAAAAANDNESNDDDPIFDGHRACAMCVKDFALFDPDDEYEEDDLLVSGKRIPLRQRKTLERQREQRDRAKKNRNVMQNNESDESGEEMDDSSNEEVSEERLETPEENGGEEEEEEDPFLKAVGGADKLLTGEAYQKALLQQEQF